MMADQPTIIAFSGRKGAGKNTVAEFVAFQFLPAYVTEYSFADPLKEFCIEILGLQHKQCYGTDEEKETPTKYQWEDVPIVCNKHHGAMTGREVMQVFGTECIRAWFGNVWAEATVRRIQKSTIPIALITDNRFPDEVKTILDYCRGYVIRLTRSPFGIKDQHASEASLDDYDWSQKKCYVLDNAKMSIEEQNQAMIPIINDIFGLWRGK